MNFLILIPARTGSKGLEDKNFLPICGVPMWAYSLQQAVVLEQTMGGEHKAYVAISTDDPTRFPENIRNYILDRPASLATDTSPIIDTIKDAVAQFEDIKKEHIDAVVLLQVSTPNRRTEDIARCVLLFIQRDGKHPVVSGHLMRVKGKGKTDTKDNPKHFQRDGGVFVLPRALIDKGVILDGDEYEVECPYATDIDTLEDFEVALAVMEYRKRMGQA